MTEHTQNNHPVGNTEEPLERPLSLSDRVRSLRLPDRSAAPPARFGWVPWVLCLLLAGLSAFFGYRAYGTDSAAEAEKTRATKLETESRPAEVVQGRAALVAGGYVVPVRRVKLSPKVGGEVLELVKNADGREIQEGDYVEKGQWIARLDRTKFEFEYRRLSAQVDQAKAEYDKLAAGNREEEKKQTEAALREAEYQRDQFKDEYNRSMRSRTATSAEELIRAESRHNQADLRVRQLEQANKMMQDGFRKEDVEKAKAAWKQAEAQRDNAKYDLDNTEVRAPVSGIILAKRAEVGDTVRPEAFSNSLSASICEMADLRHLEVDVDISERDLVSIYSGQKCEIRTEAQPERVYQGEVARQWPEANRSKASVAVRVRIEVPENDQHLRPEMRARVTFLAKPKPSSSEKEKTAAK